MPRLKQPSPILFAFWSKKIIDRFGVDAIKGPAKQIEAITKDTNKMLHSTYETTKALLKTDCSISPQERNRILKSIQQGGEGDSSRTKEPPRILRRKEAADRLSISLRTLDKWANEGLLTKITLPGKTRACGFSSIEIDTLASGNS